MKVEKIMKKYEKLNLKLAKEFDKIGKNEGTQIIYNYIMKKMNGQRFDTHYNLYMDFVNHETNTNPFHERYLMSIENVKRKLKEYSDNVGKKHPKKSL